MSMSRNFDGAASSYLTIASERLSGIPGQCGYRETRSPSAQAVAEGWLAGRDLIPAIAWEDPMLTIAHDASSEYVETYWLPFLGPSATLALRRLAAGLRTAPVSGMWVPLEPFAHSLGLQGTTAHHVRARRTLARIVRFGLANVDDDVLAVRTRIPSLTERAVERLPPHLAHQHRADPANTRLATTSRPAPASPFSIPQRPAPTSAPEGARQ